MAQEDLNQHLSQITTLWSLWCQAHQGPAEAARDAQRQLLERYGGAVRRFLGGVVRDTDLADELFQEFAFAFLHGDLRGADRQRGRLRDYVKGVLFHLVAKHHRRVGRAPGPLPDEYPEPAAGPPSLSDSDAEFLASWRDDLLARAWAGLAECERRAGQPFHAVLSLRRDRPELRSPQLAEALAARLGRPVTAAGVRQTLHRAREKFADLLLEEVLHSLEAPTAEQLEQELIDLGLLEYCRPALERRGRKGKPRERG
jgi:RNA polymerase sigma-70 factor (ECF subfamily)